MIQHSWHTKPTGHSVCPICSCPNVRAGVKHREYTPQEYRENIENHGNPNHYWVKRIKVSFGQDCSYEGVGII